MSAVELTVRQGLARLVPTSLRWRVAYWLDRRRDVCWADLVDYAMWDRERRADDPEGERTLRPILDEAAARCRAQDGCYCGKYVAGKRRHR